MDRFLRDLGERVKRARQDRGLSQSDLAEILGISDAYVSKIELGKNAMTVTVLAKLSGALGVSTDWLIRNQTREAQQITITELEEMFKGCTPSEQNTLLKLLQQMIATLHEHKKSEPTD